MNSETKKTVLCIAFFLTSMLPLHYMPPIYANADFLHSWLKNVSVGSYLYAYLVGFVVSGALFLKKPITTSNKNSFIKSAILYTFIFGALSLLFNSWLAVIARFFSGVFSCLLYIKVYEIASKTSNSKINLLGKVLGIASILLESSALLSGVISNINNFLLIKWIYVIVLFVAASASYLLLSSKELQCEENPKPITKINNFVALKFMLPSVFCFTVFFVFLLNIGYASRGLIHPFFIGLIMSSLAIAFPFGSFVAGYILRRFTYKPTIALFSLIALLGIPIQAVGISMGLWPVLLIGGFMMSISNGGIITTNSAVSMDKFSDDPVRAPLLYMIIAMTTTAVIGIASQPIEDRIVFSTLMFGLYILVLISIIVVKEKASAI